MDDLEKKLFNLDKPKLRLSADLKIKLKLYFLVIYKNFVNLKFLAIPMSHVIRNAAVGLVAVLIFVGTSIYAYASYNVTQGDALYPLKKTIESAEKILSFTNASKARTYEKISGRRFQEALVISNRDSGDKNNNANKNINETIDEAVHSFDLAAAAIKGLGNKSEIQDAINKIKESKHSHIEILNKIEKNSDKEENSEVIKKIIEAREAIEKFSGILDENEYSDDGKISVPANATSTKEEYKAGDIKQRATEENRSETRYQIKKDSKQEYSEGSSNEGDKKDREKIEAPKIINENIQNNVPETNNDEPKPAEENIYPFKASSTELYIENRESESEKARED